MNTRQIQFLSAAGIQYLARARNEPVLGLEQNSFIAQCLAVADAIAQPARVGVLAAEGLTVTAPYAIAQDPVQTGAAWATRPVPIVGAFPPPDAAQTASVQWWQSLRMLAWRLGTGAVAASALATNRSYAGIDTAAVDVWGDPRNWVLADPAAILTAPQDGAVQAAAVYLASVDFAQRLARAALHQATTSDATPSALISAALPLVQSLSSQWQDRTKQRDTRAMLVFGAVTAVGVGVAFT